MAPPAAVSAARMYEGSSRPCLRSQFACQSARVCPGVGSGRTIVDFAIGSTEPVQGGVLMATSRGSIVPSSELLSSALGPVFRSSWRSDATFGLLKHGRQVPTSRSVPSIGVVDCGSALGTYIDDTTDAEEHPEGIRPCFLGDISGSRCFVLDIQYFKSTPSLQSLPMLRRQKPKVAPAKTQCVGSCRCGSTCPPRLSCRRPM